MIHLTRSVMISDTCFSRCKNKQKGKYSESTIFDHVNLNLTKNAMYAELAMFSYIVSKSLILLKSCFCDSGDLYRSLCILHLTIIPPYSFPNLCIPISVTWTNVRPIHMSHSVLIFRFCDRVVYVSVPSKSSYSLIFTNIQHT